ncbi:PREDICTED: trihelix transcription factor ASIL2-like [Ipomoea nil]|uniref:trihelix transcription factor ASIL2-like n=1 Tax=Ipomoea nil TaxID=35883 RepID=UPI00090103F5|nr:PREDICTED: trihelix transcription factor ASIL2-like [Ipomoea nil]
MGEMMDSFAPQSAAAPASRPLPFREDCWSEEATSTLVDAWGRRYLELNRGNLRHKDWQEVADAVNSLHGHTKKGHRTDVQCKNRIDTLKKKYKTEKAKIAESNGALASTWPFFSRLDALIGNSGKNQFPKASPAAVSPSPSPSPLPSYSPLSLPSPPMGVPLPFRRPPPVAQQVILPQKRPPPAMDDSYFKKNYSAVAAAAAATDDDEADEDEEEEGRGDSEEEMETSDEITEEEGIRRLAKAIKRFGEIYERVEGMKQRQMIELEKQRMQFAKDLEVQRMQLYMDTQVQLEKIKQSKRSGSDDMYS